MADITTIIITAGCTTVATSITYALTMINTYYSDKRKSYSEQNLSILLKKVSVGEEFYSLSGLALQKFIKTLHYYESIDYSMSVPSYNVYTDSMKEKEEYVKMVSKREKSHTAVNLFFKIKSTFESSQKFENELIEIFAELADVDINIVGGFETVRTLHDKLKNTLRQQIDIIKSDRKIIQNEIHSIVAKINH